MAPHAARGCCACWSSTSTCTRATAPRRSSATTRPCSRCRCTARRTSRARKEASDLDVELPDGCGDADYLAALDAALAEAWRRHGDAPPGLAFYVAGADPHEDDRLGRLKLSFDGLAERDRRVFAALRERGIPVAVSMAGGYGRDVDDTVAVHRRTLLEALHSWRSGGAPSREDGTIRRLTRSLPTRNPR